jgi:hypothetical protein
MIPWTEMNSLAERASHPAPRAEWYDELRSQLIQSEGSRETGADVGYERYEPVVRIFVPLEPAATSPFMDF